MRVTLIFFFGYLVFMGLYCTLLCSQRRDSVSGFLGSDLAEFNELQRVVASYLDANSSSKANAM